MKTRRWLFQVGLALLVVFVLSPSGRAQEDGAESQGVDSGNYNVQQTIDFGYRASEINGNMDTYNTFLNLGSGVRLFDYTLDMRSLNHQGLLFDNLHFSNFGYGGDPDDVSRLHIDKNKWFDFDFAFRRHKNFWDYNLWANPLNPASLNPPGSLTTGCYVGPPTATYPQGAPAYCSSPANAVTTSPHSLDLVRRMQDYNLTLLPQSRVRFRLGYSHVRDQGPGFLTGDIGGTVPDLPETFSYTTNDYHAGVDFRVLPRTTISYDQFLNYFKEDNVAQLSPAATPGSYGYQLADGTPVYMGLVWSTQTPAEALPCSAPIANAATTPQTVNPVCNGYLSFSQAGPARTFMPTERIRFESTYFRKLEMSGSIGYTSSNYKIPITSEQLIGWTTRTSSPGGEFSGPVLNKRVSVDANWSGIYSVTDKFRIEDFFQFNNWRIPTLWDSTQGALFTSVGAAPATGLGVPIGAFVAANCNAGNNYSGSTCPNHTVSSAADVVEAVNANFLKQDMKTNTLELQYDFTPRITGSIGYLYDHRQIVSYASSYTVGDIYYPGGTTAVAGNDYLAARGNCAVPANCVANADGSLTFTPPSPTTGPTYYSLGVDENALLVGITARPIDALRVSGDVTFGYNSASFTRIDARQVQAYNVHATYTPRSWASLDGVVEIHENRDNVDTVNNLEHDRTYAFTATLAPNPRLAVSFGYNYWDVYSQSNICFNFTISSANPAPPPTNITDATSPPGVATTACTIPNASVGAAGVDALSTYASTDHFAHADVMWKPAKRVTTALGYGGSFVRGNTIFLNPLTPSGTLDYDYQMPYGSITIVVYRGLSYKMAWNYYGFNETGVTNPFGLAAIPLQDFNGSNATFSFRYAF
jgi:hypothetical protein